jgi:hypothetical protein
VSDNVGADDYADAPDFSDGINGSSICRYPNTCAFEDESTVGATTEAGFDAPPNNTCTFNSNVVTYKSTVWYEFQVDHSGFLDLGVFGSGAGFVPLLFYGEDYFSGPTDCFLADAGSQTYQARDIVVPRGSTVVVGVGAQNSGNDGAYDITFRWDPDSDNDGIVDSGDGCKTTPGGPHGRGGCPDADADGTVDKNDACPHLFGTVSRGCPDSDGDHLLDPNDRCPHESSLGKTDRNANGCPDRVAIPDITASTSAGKIRKVHGFSVYVSAKLRIKLAGKAPRGTKIRISCKPRKHCKIRKKGSLSKRLRSVIFSKKRKRKEVTRVTVKLTKSGYIGKYLSFKAGYKAPRHSFARSILAGPKRSSNRCIPIGKSKPTKCTSNIFLR